MSKRLFFGKKNKDVKTSYFFAGCTADLTIEAWGAGGGGGGSSGVGWNGGLGGAGNF